MVVFPVSFGGFVCFVKHPTPLQNFCETFSHCARTTPPAPIHAPPAPEPNPWPHGRGLEVRGRCEGRGRSKVKWLKCLGTSCGQGFFGDKNFLNEIQNNSNTSDWRGLFFLKFGSTLRYQRVIQVVHRQFQNSGIDGGLVFWKTQVEPRLQKLPWQKLTWSVWKVHLVRLKSLFISCVFFLAAPDFYGVFL